MSFRVKLTIPYDPCDSAHCNFHLKLANRNFSGMLSQPLGHQIVLGRKNHKGDSSDLLYNAQIETNIISTKLINLHNKEVTKHDMILFPSKLNKTATI